MRALEQCRESWRDYQLGNALRAEHECHGYLVRPEMRTEFSRRYGEGIGALARMFRRPWRERSRYATPELIRWGDRNGHTTFEQWAYHAGFRHKFLIQAKARRWG